MRLSYAVLIVRVPSAGVRSSGVSDEYIDRLGILSRPPVSLNSRMLRLFQDVGGKRLVQFYCLSVVSGYIY